MLIGHDAQMMDVPHVVLLFFICSNLVSWNARKQATVSHSSTKAEYVSGKCNCKNYLGLDYF